MPSSNNDELKTPILEVGEADDDSAQILLSKYLKSTQPQQFPRMKCCGTSRSLYCVECCRLLIPKESWPKSVQEQTLKLPFNVHIVFDKKERRSSSTGMQLMSIYNSMTMKRQNQLSQNSSRDKDDNVSTNSDDGIEKEDIICNKMNETSFADGQNNKDFVVEFYDLGRVEMPKYDDDNDDQDGVYVLFPDKDSSVPIESVSSKIQTLVVLDMKWSSQLVKEDPGIRTLPKVHLTNPPSSSHFWRWHNSGQGMVSTIEAIYFAAMEVELFSASSVARTKTPTPQTTVDNGNDDSENGIEKDDTCSTIRDTTSPSSNHHNILDMMWLFALQYATINVRSQEEQRPIPFSEEGKAVNRALRQLQRRNPRKKKTDKDSFY